MAKHFRHYAAMSNGDSRNFDLVKEAIFPQCDINEETYRQRFRMVKWKRNRTPVEMATCIRDLAEKWATQERGYLIKL